MLNCSKLLLQHISDDTSFVKYCLYNLTRLYSKVRLFIHKTDQCTKLKIVYTNIRFSKDLKAVMDTKDDNQILLSTQNIIQVDVPIFMNYFYLLL